MTVDELRDLFAKHRGEYLKYDRITKSPLFRADLAALLALDGILLQAGIRGRGANIIACAEHDRFISCLPSTSSRKSSTKLRWCTSSGAGSC